jgi:hypothetical protein
VRSEFLASIPSWGIEVHCKEALGLKPANLNLGCNCWLQGDKSPFDWLSARHDEPVSRRRQT